MRYYQLTPLDTLFFRDGSPFNAGETGQMEVRGIFPPSPTTVAGALRAAFARELGWNGDSRDWDVSTTGKLGKGNDLDPLRFSGLYLARDEEPLFPAPLHLLRTGDKKHLSWLKPGGELQTDLGPARLPEVEKKYDAEREIRGFKPLEDAYLTLEAMQDVLNGELPDTNGIIPADKLWASEARVGIQRDRETRTTKEDALYQTVHVRLHAGVGLVMGVDGYDGDAPEISTLGGESRMVSLEPYDHFTLPKAPDLEPSGGIVRYTVTLITPAAGVDGRSGESALPGEVVSACIGKPVMIGGWDGKARRPKDLEPHLPPDLLDRRGVRPGRPKDLEPHLPAGSTWFMKAREHEKEEVLKYHGAYIGERTEWGYGQILIGAWR